MAPTERRKVALVTGANGFIGHAAAKAFVAAGYSTYGLVRRPDAIETLQQDEIHPILGSPDAVDSWLPGLLAENTTFDVIVSNTENLLNYTPHFRNILSMLKLLARASLDQGVKPLLIFASGCKDYGKGSFHQGGGDNAPYTEESELKPAEVLVPRCSLSLTVFDYPALWDAIVTRPTTVYGGSSSYYGAAFHVAAAAAAQPQGQRMLSIAANPNSIVHGTHVADVAAAYVQLAEAHASGRSKVAGQCYNISAEQYETAQEVADALVREYQLDGVDWVAETWEETGRRGFDVVGLLFGFSQWIGSDKIRRDIGWREVRPLFTHNLRVYRAAFEAAERQGHSNVARVRGFIDMWDGK